MTGGREQIKPFTRAESDGRTSLVSYAAPRPLRPAKNFDRDESYPAVNRTRREILPIPIEHFLRRGLSKHFHAGVDGADTLVHRFELRWCLPPAVNLAEEVWAVKGT